MILDVERNDLGRVSRTGSVRLLRAPYVETLPTLHHRLALLESQLAPVDLERFWEDQAIARAHADAEPSTDGVARAHAGQLIHITHQHEVRARVNRLEQRIAQNRVKHRGFIHDHDQSVDRAPHPIKKRLKKLSRFLILLGFTKKEMNSLLHSLWGIVRAWN